jgi:effector-binding domain-containing protein
MMNIRLSLAMIMASLLWMNAHGEDAKPAEAPKLDAQIKDVKKQSTLVIKKTVKKTEIATALAAIYPKVFKFVEEKKIKLLSAPMAKYKVVGDNFEMEAGVVVAEGTKGEGDIVSGELPEGKVGFVVHTGAYEKLPETYKALGEWMKTKGLTPAPLGWEIYISDPGQTKPEEVKTEVYLMAEPEKK